MSKPDLQADGKRVHFLLVLSSILLLVAMGAVGVKAYNTSWRATQRAFAGIKENRGADHQPTGVQQIASCAGEVDRCTTCHLGMERKDLAKENIPLPFRAHGAGLGKHKVDQIGCTVCHGGNSRVLDTARSHASPDGREKDPLMKQPHIQASCARCHLVGEKPGQERLLEGANLYAGLGCPACHPLVDQGKGGWDFGPDLTAIGRKSLNDLKTSLMDPAANFEGSTMPSFRLALEKDTRAMESLLIYLESLVLPKVEACGNQHKSRGLVNRPCSDCHAGAKGMAGGRMMHRCPYLIDRAAELKCERCHGDGVPDSAKRRGYCPLISQHREGCVLCHREAEKGGAK